jgi:hypothetical protein
METIGDLFAHSSSKFRPIMQAVKSDKSLPAYLSVHLKIERGTEQCEQCEQCEQ